MISIIKIGSQSNTDVLEIVGLANDTKPIQTYQNQPITNGSTFLEMDTGKVFIYSAGDDTWYEM